MQQLKIPILIGRRLHPLTCWGVVMEVEVVMVVVMEVVMEVVGT